MAFMGAESKYIMYNHSSVFNREFPSDDECYSSDYESYWSTAASSSSDADEPASKSQIISRPQTSKSMKSLAKPVSEAEDDDESDCFEDEETIPNDVSKRAENQSENGEEKRPKTAKELAKRFTETVILQPARLVYSAQGTVCLLKLFPYVTRRLNNNVVVLKRENLKLFPDPNNR